MGNCGETTYNLNRINVITLSLGNIAELNCGKGLVEQTNFKVTELALSCTIQYSIQ
jgi:hypothetical protein